MPEARLARTRRAYDGHEHDFRARWMPALDEYHAVCRLCGHDAGVAAIPPDWNVIEGEYFDPDAHLGAVDTE